MLQFIQNQVILYIAIGVILFLPGYAFLLALFGKKNIFSALEKFVISFGVSIILVDFLMLILAKLQIPFSRFSLLTAISLFAGLCLIIYFFRQRKESSGEAPDFAFSKNQLALTILIFFLTLFLKSAYLETNMVPSTTDLGHHMYWSKVISTSGTIPDYAKRDIVKVGEKYTISDPQPISDFIIGEHLIFSAVNIVSEIDFISYFPIILLFLINVFSILALFILALRFFEDHPQGKNIAILSLLFIGPLFTIAPPQVKYASGGVIGNIIGNLLMPLAFYFVYRALKEKNAIFLMLSIAISMGIFYTHHLTGFIFLLALTISLVIILASNFRRMGSLIWEWLKLFFSWPVILFLIFAAVFVFYIYTPTYLTNLAVETVAGAPAKAEHQGLSFSEFKFTVGEPRLVLGLVGIFLLLLILAFRKSNYQSAFLAGWIGVILLISLFPNLVKISLPSARVANYGGYPLAILAAFALIQIIRRMKNTEDHSAFLINPKFLLTIFTLLLSFIFVSGFYDNSAYKERIPDFSQTAQTLHASQYLSREISTQDEVLADHIFITSDSWIKLFFLRDYYFPFFRANLERYSNGIDKTEFCTLWMISTPLSADAQKCYNDLGMDFVMINRKMDSPQFNKSDQFELIYSNEEIGIYYRKNNSL